MFGQTEHVEAAERRAFAATLLLFVLTLLFTGCRNLLHWYVKEDLQFPEQKYSTIDTLKMDDFLYVDNWIQLLWILKWEVLLRLEFFLLLASFNLVLLI